MIGLLFHGPEVFDSGWAQRILEALKGVGPIRCMLAGTMGRTAAMDSGLSEIECPGKQPSQILREWQGDVDAFVFANFGKSEAAGLLHGAMIAERAGIQIPLLQVECSGRCYVEWHEGLHPAAVTALEKLGLQRKNRIEPQPALWERDGRVFRRLSTAAAGEFLLVDGIVIGKALGGDVIIEASGREIVDVQNAEIKAHGIEKLMRLGGIDLRTAKLASTSSLRRSVVSPITAKAYGKGIEFVDHAGMHIYDRVQGREGVVTVGDDTTAIVGDILYRAQIPLIGITDGDRDTLLGETRFTPGSTVFVVPEDDRMGLRIFAEIFQNQRFIGDDFKSVRDRIMELIGADLLNRTDF